MKEICIIMDAHKKVLEGIMLLDSLPEGEIEERIEWLEQALEAYRLILNYKRLMKSKPAGIEESKSARIEEPKPVQNTNGHVYIDSKTLNDRVLEYIRSRGDEGVQISSIAFDMNEHVTRISACIQYNRRYYDNFKKGWWRVKGQYALHNNEVGSRETQVGDSTLQSQLQ